MPNLEDLPPELQLRIMRHMVANEADKIRIISTSYRSALSNPRFPFSFISPGCVTFSNVNTTHNKSAAINYRYAVLDHIMNDDGDVYATVKDLQYQNLKKLVKFLEGKNKLHPFLKQGGREIWITHTVTKGFPIEATRLQKWAKFTDSFTNEQAKEELAILQYVGRLDDANAKDGMVSFLRAVDDSHECQENYDQFKDALCVFHEYVGELLVDSLAEVAVAGLSEEQQYELDCDREYMEANAAEDYPAWSDGS